MHLGKNMTYEYLLRQLVFYQFINAVNDGMFKEDV